MSTNLATKLQLVTEANIRLVAKIQSLEEKITDLLVLIDQLQQTLLTPPVFPRGDQPSFEFFLEDQDPPNP